MFIVGVGMWDVYSRSNLCRLGGLASPAGFLGLSSSWSTYYSFLWTLCIMYGILHIITIIISLQCNCTNFLFCFAKSWIQYGKGNKGSLEKTGLKKYQKYGKSKREYLFLWPINLSYYVCDIMPTILVFTFF